MVGALLVYNDVIIGEGYHKVFGGAHAEVNCLQNVSPANKHLIPASTMYVSLEPCIHFGKTPPCADLIIESGIKKVVIACSDPFEKVNGGGIQKLKEAGIHVMTPLLNKRSIELNKRFFTFHTRQRPYVILKWAQSSDGKISFDGKRYPISNESTNVLVHRWRSEEGAIVIGTNTAITDNPSLTTRHWPGTNPLRLVIDMKLRISQDSLLFTDDEPLVIFNGHLNKQVGKRLFYKCSEQNILPELMDFLRARNVTSLIVEGGGRLLQSFIDKGLWDEARIITNRTLQINKGTPSPILHNAVEQARYQILNDEVRILINETTSSF